jgi:hypothetical protein
MLHGGFQTAQPKRRRAGAVQILFFLFFTWQWGWTFDTFPVVKVAPRIATHGRHGRNDMKPESVE